MDKAIFNLDKVIVLVGQIHCPRLNVALVLHSHCVMGPVLNTKVKQTRAEAIRRLLRLEYRGKVKKKKNSSICFVFEIRSRLEVAFYN